MNIFRRKSVTQLQADALTDDRLKRALGATNLTALGIGAIIGTGIFVLTGTVAAQNAGPAVVLSFVLAGVASVVAALCYSEFASLVPMAGSAYTYPYATLGELFAWIIGWDLILEYAVASMTVAHGWSKNLQDILSVFGIHLPKALANSPFDYDPATGHFFGTGSVLDLPGIAIAVLVTWVLVIGIKESARFNTTMVAIKVAIVLFVIGVGAFYVDSANWHPFAP